MLLKDPPFFPVPAGAVMNLLATSLLTLEVIRHDRKRSSSDDAKRRRRAQKKRDNALKKIELRKQRGETPGSSPLLEGLKREENMNPDELRHLLGQGWNENPQQTAERVEKEWAQKEEEESEDEDDESEDYEEESDDEDSDDEKEWDERDKKRRR